MVLGQTPERRHRQPIPGVHHDARPRSRLRRVGPDHTANFSALFGALCCALCCALFRPVSDSVHGAVQLAEQVCCDPAIAVPGYRSLTTLVLYFVLRSRAFERSEQGSVDCAYVGPLERTLAISVRRNSGF